MEDNILEVSHVDMVFQGIRALDDVSFTVRANSITAVIGPNGAGKTTLFNCMTGMYRPTKGRILFRGVDVAGRPPYRISRSGIARTFQNLALFHDLSVLENVMVGGYAKGSSGLFAGAFTTRRSRSDAVAAADEGRRMLRMVGLDDMADRRPSESSYGQQKRIEFARALMHGANLILLDEPMAGMDENEKAEMSELIRRIRIDLGVTFLVVEHDIPVIMGISDRIVVLDYGRKIADGDPATVRSDPVVIEAYLGAADEAPFMRRRRAAGRLPNFESPLQRTGPNRGAESAPSE